MASLDLLVVCDAFFQETARLAHYVLPVKQWAEEGGTMTNLEGRVIRRRPAVHAPDGVPGDLDVLCGLAARLGHGDQFAFVDSEAVFEELRLASAGGKADYRGISYARIDAQQGVFWPCPSEDHPGTPRLFDDRFAFPDGRARFIVARDRPSAEVPDEDYPLWFTTGRYREHYNSGAQTRRIGRLMEVKPAPCLELHPWLADRIGVREGAPVVVESRRGSATFQATVTPDIRPDTVFAPFHWGDEWAANLLTHAALDPISRMPEFKVCAARLRLDASSWPTGPGREARSGEAM